MTEPEVIDLMASSMSAQEWKANTVMVKEAFGGTYPEFWYSAVIKSGLADLILGRWGDSTKITVIKEEFL